MCSGDKNTKILKVVSWILYFSPKHTVDNLIRISPTLLEVCCGQMIVNFRLISLSGSMNKFMTMVSVDCCIPLMTLFFVEFPTLLPASPNDFYSL